MEKNLKLEDFMEGKTDALSIKQKYLKTISKEEKKNKNYIYNSKCYRFKNSG